MWLRVSLISANMLSVLQFLAMASLLVGGNQDGAEPAQAEQAQDSSELEQEQQQATEPEQDSGEEPGELAQESEQEQAEPDPDSEGQGEAELSGLSESDIGLSAEPELDSTEPEAEYIPWYERWPGGLRFAHEVEKGEGRTEDFISSFTGLLQLDGAQFHPDSSTGEFEDLVEVRRARLVGRGAYTGWLRASYMLQVGYDYPDWLVYDAFVALHDRDKLQTIQLGYFRMPMTLSGRESGRDTVMMERPAAVTSFWPNRRLGAQIASARRDKRMTWRGGVFTIGVDDNEGNNSDAPLQASGRVTGLPWLSGSVNKPGGLLHVGLSGLYQFSDSSDIQYRARPESRLAPFLVDTGSMEGKHAFTMGAEAAAIRGPYSLATEYLHSFVSGTDGDLNFSGAYVTGSWILTGETRPYDPNLAVFSRLRPKYNMAGGDNLIGALEAVVHASHLDLSDDLVDGGTMNMLGAGLNWYWNPTVSFQVNGLYGDVVGGPTPGDLRIFQVRFQLTL